MKLSQSKVMVQMGKQRLRIEDLAKTAGVSTTTIMGMRKGKNCRLSSAAKVSEALGLPLEEIVEEW